MRRRPSEEWVARLQKAGVPCAPINDITHMKAHPQTAALGMVQPVPEIDLDLMSLPLSIDGERPTIRTRAPKLGEHNAVGAGVSAGEDDEALAVIPGLVTGTQPSPRARASGMLDPGAQARDDIRTDSAGARTGW